MSDRHTLFKSESVPADQLSERILLCIGRMERKNQRARFTIFTSITVISLIALVPAIQLAHREITQSGFNAYISLIFSDSKIVFASWKEFGLLLAESLPVLGITAITAVLAVTIFSIRETAHTIRTIRFINPTI